MAPDSAELVAKIYNAAWMVRHYARGGRQSRESAQAALRREAIHDLGIVCRDAFNKTDDFEPLLIAIFDGLQQKDAPPF